MGVARHVPSDCVLSMRGVLRELLSQPTVGPHYRSADGHWSLAGSTYGRTLRSSPSVSTYQRFTDGC